MLTNDKKPTRYQRNKARMPKFINTTTQNNKEHSLPSTGMSDCAEEAYLLKYQEDILDGWEPKEVKQITNNNNPYIIDEEKRWIEKEMISIGKNSTTPVVFKTYTIWKNKTPKKFNNQMLKTIIDTVLDCTDDPENLASPSDIFNACSNKVLMRSRVGAISVMYQEINGSLMPVSIGASLLKKGDVFSYDIGSKISKTRMIRNFKRNLSIEDCIRAIPESIRTKACIIISNHLYTYNKTK